MHDLTCLKCQTKYQDSEPDNYLCVICLTERKTLAAGIDKKRALHPPRPTKSDLQVFDEIRKATGQNFPNYKNFIH